jgi:hypothetical protein
VPSAGLASAITFVRWTQRNDDSRTCALIGKAARGGSFPEAMYRGGEDVVGVAVEILAGPVVAHGGSWVGVAGGDRDVAQADAGVEYGRHERVAQHMRVEDRQARRQYGEQERQPYITVRRQRR